MHVGVGGKDMHGGHIGSLARNLLRWEGGRIDVEAVGIVEGILGDAARIQGEEIDNRLPRDVDAGGIDEDETADSTGLVTGSHVSGDPAADGGTDDQDVLVAFVLEKLEVDARQVAYAGKPVGALSSVPARVSGDDDVHGRSEMVGNTLYGRWAAAAVQDERDTASTGLGNRDGEVGTQLDSAIGKRFGHLRAPTFYTSSSAAGVVA